MKLTRQQKKLMEASLLVARDQPSSQDKAFLARQLVQTTLPHSDPGNVPVWTRKNGDLTLVIQQGISNDGQLRGYPYGTIPRLVLYWITTEALRTKNPRLELGNNLAEFMEEVGLDPKGKGPRSDRVRLEDQMRRLFSAQIRFESKFSSDGKSGEVTEYMKVASRTVYWWNTKQPEQMALNASYVILDQRFYETITANPIPVDLRALRAIKNSALALDLYSLLTYQAFSAGASDRPRFMSWAQLQLCLGTNYADTGDFRKKVKTALVKIKAVYPDLIIGARTGGIEVLPDSRPAIDSRTVDCG